MNKGRVVVMRIPRYLPVPVPLFVSAVRVLWRAE